jgi:demethylmenaquinone methyltransferase/2-methoxy-6-polyprenyl-1,4-benzoquinol methylase
MKTDYHPIPKAGDPDRQEALRNYNDLAPQYDDTCRPIEGIRLDTINTLALKEGDVVLDIACGTGATLPELARLVGPTGKVIGIELSPEMARQAQEKVNALGSSTPIKIIVAPMEDFSQYLPSDLKADAALLCFTQDVLQSPAALGQLFSHLKPQARLAVSGIRLQPWWYAWPVNIWALTRCKRYFTTTRGLLKPWLPLQPYCADITVRRSYYAGHTYLATGTYTARNAT